MNHRAWHAFAGCGVAIVVAGTMALVTGLPWLFPSLGPTAMLQTEQPSSDSSSPRNTLIGHAVALGAGYGSLLLFDLQATSPAPTADMSARRIGAAALSLAVTAAVLLLVRRPHAPAGATTLIVSLGLLHTPVELLVAFASVAAVTAVDWTYNRLTGEPMPVWRAPGPGADRRQPR